VEKFEKIQSWRSFLHCHTLHRSPNIGQTRLHAIESYGSVMNKAAYQTKIQVMLFNGILLHNKIQLFLLIEIKRFKINLSHVVNVINELNNQTE
jgi:hypothetical protein